MKWIVRTVVALVTIVAVVVIVGWLLPVNHEASRSAEFKRPPQEVYSVIADIAAYPTWYEGVTKIETLPSATGKTRFREHMTTGPIIMEIDDANPPSRFVTRIADPEQPFGGSWTFEISPTATGSRLTITERGEIYNPIFRFMARFFLGYTSTMDGFLGSLTRKLGGSEEVRSEEVRK